MMPFERFLPLLMMFLSVGASVPYWVLGDWRKGLYWLFAAGLTFTVTF